MSIQLPDCATERAFELEGVFEPNYPNTELWADLLPNQDGSFTWVVHSGWTVVSPLDHELPPYDERTAPSPEAARAALMAWVQGEVMRDHLADEATAARIRRERNDPPR